MSPVADLVARLIAAGTPPELAAVVVTEAFAAGSVRGNSADKADTQAERRRAADRDRKRLVRGHSAESADIPQTPQTVLLPTKINKKVGKKRTVLSADWKPNEGHYDAASKLNIPRAAVDTKAEDMRIWAGSTGAVKLDWDLTFHGFLRRDAPKLSVKPLVPVATLVVITPDKPNWNAWKSHFRDTGKNSMAAQMDRMATDGKPYTVPTEWPPGHRGAH